MGFLCFSIHWLLDKCCPLITREKGEQEDSGEDSEQEQIEAVRKKGKRKSFLLFQGGIEIGFFPF